ncbi:MAG: SH3 domain-containing protein, partial [Anaerolinea sp.]|nr:SH3 domain-containing protein [Anaerolinea sp.]
MKRLALLALLLSFLLLFGVSVHASGDQQQLAIPHLVVNTSFLNARSGPGPQYTVITTLVGGTELPVLGTNSDNTWYLVTTAAGNAWVDVSFTLARGVFDYVPEIDVFAAAPVALTLPVTIGLPGSTSSAG